MRIEGFNQKNHEIVLKYDFERWRHKYSVIVVPLLDRSSMISDDTNNVLASLIEIVQERQLDISEEAICTFVDLFECRLKSLIKEKGEEVIFSFSAIKEEEILYSVYLSLNKNIRHIQNVSFEEVKKFLEK